MPSIFFKVDNGAFLFSSGLQYARVIVKVVKSCSFSKKATSILFETRIDAAVPDLLNLKFAERTTETVCADNQCVMLSHCALCGKNGPESAENINNNLIISAI